MAAPAASCSLPQTTNQQQVQATKCAPGFTRSNATLEQKGPALVVLPLYVKRAHTSTSPMWPAHWHVPSLQRAFRFAAFLACASQWILAIRHSVETPSSIHPPSSPTLSPPPLRPHTSRPHIPCRPCPLILFAPYPPPPAALFPFAPACYTPPLTPPFPTPLALPPLLQHLLNPHFRARPLPYLTPHRTPKPPTLPCVYSQCPSSPGHTLQSRPLHPLSSSRAS